MTGSRRDRFVQPEDLAPLPTPATGWPPWVFDAPYDGSQHPQAIQRNALELGANCQRFAYAFLALFGLIIPARRSSELWDDARFEHAPTSAARDLDLVLFNSTATAWGAHVGVVVGSRVLHLSREVGRPALWTWAEFATRPRYNTVIGLVRPDNPADDP